MKCTIHSASIADLAFLTIGNYGQEPPLPLLCKQLYKQKSLPLWCKWPYKQDPPSHREVSGFKSVALAPRGATYVWEPWFQVAISHWTTDAPLVQLTGFFWQFCPPCSYDSPVCLRHHGKHLQKAFFSSPASGHPSHPMGDCTQPWLLFHFLLLKPSVLLGLAVPSSTWFYSECLLGTTTPVVQSGSLFLS